MTYVHSTPSGEEAPLDGARSQATPEGLDPLCTPVNVAHHMHQYDIRCTHCKRGVKRPGHTGWPFDHWTPDQFEAIFAPSENIIVLPKPSRIVDGDFDAPEAARIADDIFPKTGMIWGRPGKPRSHRIYRLPEGETLESGEHVWKDPDPAPGQGVTLLELRSNGHTVAPGSVWTNSKDRSRKEWVRFTADGREAPATHAKAALLTAANETAALALIARHWNDGERHEMSLPLAGFFYRGGMGLDAAQRLMGLICKASGDNDPADVRNRLEAMRDTYRNGAEGKEITGRRRLVQEHDLTHRQLDRVAEWLGLEEHADALPSGVAVPLGPDGLPLDATGNGDRFVRMWQGQVIYCAAEGRWYIYQNAIWVPDRIEHIRELAKATTEAFRTLIVATNAEVNAWIKEIKKAAEVVKAAEAAKAESVDTASTVDPNIIVTPPARPSIVWSFEGVASKDKCVKHARAMGTGREQEDMLKQARSRTGMSVTPEQFDALDLVLNCPNGTLWLNTTNGPRETWGTWELKPHNPADLQTMMTAAPYVPGATR